MGSVRTLEIVITARTTLVLSACMCVCMHDGGGEKPGQGWHMRMDSPLSFHGREQVTVPFFCELEIPVPDS